MPLVLSFLGVVCAASVMLSGRTDFANVTTRRTMLASCGGGFLGTYDASLCGSVMTTLPTTAIFPAPIAPQPAPANYPIVQYPSVWNGAHALSGSEQEWAREDAAQHALNLANWRIKILEAKLQQAKLSTQVMNVQSGLSPEDTASAPADAAQSSDFATQNELKEMQQNMVTIAKGTASAVQLLESQLESKRGMSHSSRRSYVTRLNQLKAHTDKELDHLLDTIDAAAQKAKKI